MSEKINIFKNLEELRNTNILEQLKSLEATEVNLSDSQGLDDDFDFDTICDQGNSKKSPSKRHLKNEKAAIPEKISKKQTRNSRRSSTSTDGSLSPTMPLLENVGNYVDALPVARRTRKSLGACAQVPETILDSFNASQEVRRGKGRPKGRGKGRGRGRGRGRGTGNASLSVSISNGSSEFVQNDLTNVLEISSNEVSQQDVEITQNSSTLGVMERFLQQGNRGRSRVMRARRRYFAEIAARSTQVDYVDLVSSPMPRVEGFIDLDSYTEEEPQRKTRSKKKNQDEIFSQSNHTMKSRNPALEISLEEDNPELNIKVNWKGKPEAFKLRKHQKFSVILEQISKRENINVGHIVFNLHNRIIMPDDTPDSINYKIFHFIDGRVLSGSCTSPKAATAVGKKRDANKITLKIQSDKWKRPLEIDIRKTDMFRILYIKCAEELNVGIDQLKLSFDGEKLELNDAPTDLDLEGGELIDLHIQN